MGSNQNRLQHKLGDVPDRGVVPSVAWTLVSAMSFKKENLQEVLASQMHCLSFSPSAERSPGTKEMIKSQESLFFNQWPQNRKDTCGEEGHSDPVCTMSMTLPTKKPVWPAEKNLLYEFFGATKNPSGQLRLRTKVDMDGLDLKCK